MLFSASILVYFFYKFFFFFFVNLSNRKEASIFMKVLRLMRRPDSLQSIEVEPLMMVGMKNLMM